MIRLDIQGYCDACCDFSPEVVPPFNYVQSDGTVERSDTVVRCKYAKRCENIKRYLSRRLGDE